MAPEAKSTTVSDVGMATGIALAGILLLVLVYVAVDNRATTIARREAAEAFAAKHGRPAPDLLAYRAPPPAASPHYRPPGGAPTVMALPQPGPGRRPPTQGPRPPQRPLRAMAAAYDAGRLIPHDDFAGGEWQLAPPQVQPSMPPLPRTDGFQRQPTRWEKPVSRQPGILESPPALSGQDEVDRRTQRHSLLTGVEPGGDAGMLTAGELHAGRSFEPVQRSNRSVRGVMRVRTDPAPGALAPRLTPRAPPGRTLRAR